MMNSKDIGYGTVVNTDIALRIFGETHNRLSAQMLIKVGTVRKTKGPSEHLKVCFIVDNYFCRADIPECSCVWNFAFNHVFVPIHKTQWAVTHSYCEHGFFF